MSARSRAASAWESRPSQADGPQSRADAARTIHVGDLYHVDVVGARRAGLRDGILLDLAGLYDEVDCPRVNSLTELVEWIDKPSGNQTRKRVP